MAGLNKTMAEWTVDKWTEYGFTSRLDEYGKHMELVVTTTH